MRIGECGGQVLGIIWWRALQVYPPSNADLKHDVHSGDPTQIGSSTYKKMPLNFLAWFQVTD